jgi:predicted SAM-dependent methyltransferase
MGLTGRLPFADSTIDAVYASHVLEHLHLEDGIRLLSECRRILRRGDGVLRLVLPDTRRMAIEYLASEDPIAAERFNRELMFRPAVRARGLRRLYEALADFHSHKFMYDEAYLMRLLESEGFREAAACGFGQSRIPEIAEVEDPGRVLGGAGFIVEAVL